MFHPLNRVSELYLYEAASAYYTIFISHMVQIKRWKSSWQFISFDNFISHMVQIKLDFYKITDTMYCCFISHMVQIKPVQPKKERDYDFYFISHMVQIKPYHISSLKFSLSPLYIPHGSDKTYIICGVMAIGYESLYPTWFR